MRGSCNKLILPGAGGHEGGGRWFELYSPCNLQSLHGYDINVLCIIGIRQIKYLSYKLNAKVELLLVKMMQKLRNGMFLPLVYLSQ